MANGLCTTMQESRTNTLEFLIYPLPLHSMQRYTRVHTNLPQYSPLLFLTLLLKMRVFFLPKISEIHGTSSTDATNDVTDPPSKTMT